jgi:hypothetical protein
VEQRVFWNEFGRFLHIICPQSIGLTRVTRSIRVKSKWEASLIMPKRDEMRHIEKHLNTLNPIVAVGSLGIDQSLFILAILVYWEKFVKLLTRQPSIPFMPVLYTERLAHSNVQALEGLLMHYNGVEEAIALQID